MYILNWKKKIDLQYMQYEITRFEIAHWNQLLDTFKFKDNS